MIQVLRWLAIIPACVAAFYFALFIALYVRSSVAALCPPELVVSGFCEASWYPAAEQAVFCFGVALSAFLIVLTAAGIAPTHRVLVSKAALGVGTLIAILFAVETGEFLALAAAVLAGILAMLVVTTLLSRARHASRNVA
ncbi:hypothetical protein [Luteimonas sp. MC1825]|nr:hypothetical protein [Luteimonas sp. MC1825]MBB6598034.1 hypothetical protein [Luteimonas sp. MC1825]QOC88273.1 hypothetical protein IDM46_00365 [Luteimonas sp. MC1825]